MSFWRLTKSIRRICHICSVDYLGVISQVFVLGELMSLLAREKNGIDAKCARNEVSVFFHGYWYFYGVRCVGPYHQSE